MYKTKIKREGKIDIYLEYNKKKYDIEYIETKNILILRRLSDKKVLEIFSDNIGFIIQYNTENKTNFLVTDYSQAEEKHTAYFKHYYTSNSFLDTLHLKNEFECEELQSEKCRITDKSYLIGNPHFGSYIYNLEERSKRFEHVYNDKRINKILNSNTLLVTEKRTAFYSNEITDTITYGINPETFEIITPIWSELQQRYINIYTKEEIEKIKEEYKQKGLWINSTYSTEDITIHLEIQKYLDKLVEYLDKPKHVYLDSDDDKINKDFIKGFSKRKTIK